LLEQLFDVVVEAGAAEFCAGCLDFVRGGALAGEASEDGAPVR
jgi:hypothetical protein